MLELVDQFDEGVIDKDSLIDKITNDREISTQEISLKVKQIKD